MRESRASGVGFARVRVFLGVDPFLRSADGDVDKIQRLVERMF